MLLIWSRNFRCTGSDPAGSDFRCCMSSGVLHRNRLGNIRDSDSDYYCNLRSGGTGTADYHTVCYTGRFCLWRSYFSDFRYNNSGFYRCTVQPPEARCHTGAICSNCSRMLSGRLHNRRTDRKNGIWYQYSNHIRSLFSAAVCSIEHFAKVFRKEEISVRLIRY